MVAPRERGRYSGYIGAVFAVATVSGPLIGGVIVDIPGSAGAGASSSASVRRRRVRGAAEDAAPADRPPRGPHRLPRRDAASSAASRCCWSGSRWPATSSPGSPPTASPGRRRPRRPRRGHLRRGAVAVEPIIPLRLFRDRTTALATPRPCCRRRDVRLDGLPQPVLPARPRHEPDRGRPDVDRDGRRPAGLQHRRRPAHHRTGRWKRYLVGGMVAGHRRPGLLATIDETTNLCSSASSWPCSASASARPCRTSCSRCRTTSPCPTWARPARWSPSSARMGGSIGVSALGAVLEPPGRRRRRGRDWPRWASPATRTEAGSDPRPATLPAPVRAIFEHAFGEATGHLFLVALPFAVLALVCVLFIQEVPLRTTVLRDDELAPEAAAELRRGDHADDPRRRPRRLEREVGVLIRRVRRVIGERARAVHEDLQPASYLLLAHLAEVGPSRSSAIVEAFGIDKGAISRQVQHLVDLGLVERAPTPRRPRHADLITDEGRARLAPSPGHRRKLSTSGSATGPRTSSTCSSRRSAATTRRLDSDVASRTQPVTVSRRGPRRPCRRQLAVDERAAGDQHLARGQRRPGGRPQLTTTVTGPRSERPARRRRRR